MNSEIFSQYAKYLTELKKKTKKHLSKTKTFNKKYMLLKNVFIVLTYL